MGRVLVAVMTLLLASCSRTPSALEPLGVEIDECAVITDAVVDLLQDQLDALAGASLDDIVAGPLPPELAESVTDADELADRAADAGCDPAAISAQVGSRLGALEARSELAVRYLQLIQGRFALPG